MAYRATAQLEDQYAATPNVPVEVRPAGWLSAPHIFV